MTDLGGFDGCVIFFEKVLCTWEPSVSLICLKNAAKTPILKGKELLEKWVVKAYIFERFLQNDGL